MSSDFVPYKPLEGYRRGPGPRPGRSPRAQRGTVLQWVSCNHSCLLAQKQGSGCFTNGPICQALWELDLTLQDAQKYTFHVYYKKKKKRYLAFYQQDGDLFYIREQMVGNSP